MNVDFGDEDDEYPDQYRRESIDEANLPPNDLENLEENQFNHFNGENNEEYDEGHNFSGYAGLRRGSEVS